MYLLNDGRTLEVTFGRSAAFSSREDREAILEALREGPQPLVIRMAAGHQPAPIELRFLAELIQVARSLGRRVSFRGGAGAFQDSAGSRASNEAGVASA